MKNSTAFSLVLFSLLFLVKNEMLAQPKNVDQSFLGVDRIEIDLSISAVEFIASTSAEVFVEGYFDEDEVKVKVWKDGSVLYIDEKLKIRTPNGIHSTWKIAIPQGMKLYANLRGGNVAMEGCSGEIKGNCGTGGLNLVDFKGEVEWNCGTGNYEMTNGEGEFSMNTGTGNIQLTNLRGEVSANSGTGRLKIQNCQGGINANSGTGDVYASNLVIEKASSFNSGTGDVEVKLGGHTHADLTVNSGTGDAELDMNSQNFDGTLTMQCNERGGKIIAPFGFDKEWTKGAGRNQKLIKQKKFGDSGVEVKVGTGTGEAEVNE